MNERKRIEKYLQLRDIMNISTEQADLFDAVSPSNEQLYKDIEYLLCELQKHELLYSVITRYFTFLERTKEHVDRQEDTEKIYLKEIRKILNMNVVSPKTGE